MLRVALVCALLVSSNMHLAVLQMTAWARMLISYSRDNTVATALEMTFDGEHPCPMCKKIQQAAARAEDSAQLRAAPTGPAHESGYPLIAFARLRAPGCNRHDYESADRRCPEPRIVVPPTPPPIAA